MYFLAEAELETYSYEWQFLKTRITTVNAYPDKVQRIIKAFL